MSSANLKVVFGAMTFGPPGTIASRVHDLETQSAMLDLFKAYGHNEIDTARLYGEGHTEGMLAQNDWAGRGFIIGTKLYPSAVINKMLKDKVKLGVSYDHRPEDVRRGVMDSLKALGTDKIDLWYLHGPDRNTPYEDTLGEIHALYEEGYFKAWGVSNYMAWEVAQMNEICIRNNWIRPTVYQGVYHIFGRNVEDELFSCLRHYGMSFYAFGPLAGGLMTGKYTRGQTDFEPGSRFDPGATISITHRGRYWNDIYFDGLDEIKVVAEKHNLTLAEIALKWLNHHSKLEKAKGDAIIVGASSIKHLESNLVDLGKGALPDEIVTKLEEVWVKIRSVAPVYWH